MEMDIAKLAAETAALLTPFLPYLIKGGKLAAKKAFEKSGELFAEKAWEQAEKVWEKIWPKAKKKEAAKEAVEDAAQHPKDGDAQGALRRQLTKLLEADEKLRQVVIENLTVDLSTHVQAGDNSVVIGGNCENSNIISNSDNSRIIHAKTYIEGNVYKGAAPRNSQEALKIYRDVVASFTANLPMRGIDMEVSDPTSAQKPIGLAHVYVALDTRTQAITADKVAGSRAVIEKESKPLSVLEVVSKYRSAVIKGDPGSGKSTFVNFLANCLATQNTSALIGWNKDENDLLPVIVILRDFAKSLPKKLPPQAEPCHLCDFLNSRLKAQNLQASTKPIFEMLEQGKAVVFFDGLDEVPTREQRVFVRDAVQTFAKRYAKNRFLVTCRVLSYQPPKSKNEPDLRLANFPEFELAPFDDKKITAFIDGWYNELSNLGIVTADEAKDSVQRLKTAVQRPELHRLAPNPLLLTVMALVNTHKGRLPDARAVLYDETIDILLWRWEQGSKGQESRLRQLLLEANYQDKDLEQVIWQLAYEAHEQTSAEDENDSLAGISELKLQKVLAEKNNGNLNWAAQMIETMKLRAGLLLERDTGVFTFPHRSFQEYLAATWLDAQDDFVNRAKSLAENPAIWREVILWAVSRRVYVRGSISGPLALVAELCPSRMPSNQNGWSNIWLAGDILLEIGLNRILNTELGKDLLPRVQDRLVQLLEQNALTPRERASAADTLARLGDPRPGVINDFLFCEIPAGVFQMGEGNEQFQYDKIKSNYFMSRYPITNAQFGLFVSADGYKTEKYWSEAKQAKYWNKSGFKGRYDDEVRTAPVQFNAPFNLPNHPVVGVSWYEALAFTRWATENIGRIAFSVWRDRKVEPLHLETGKHEIRLPSEAEWERAARGNPLPEGEGRVRAYPWGDEITPNHANYSDTGIGTTSAVGCFPLGTNEFGLLDMSGNVWEWCATQWQDSYKNYLEKEKKLNNPEGDSLRVVRGGSYFNVVWNLRCAVRFRFNPSGRGWDFGFRVVVRGVSPISP